MARVPKIQVQKQATKARKKKVDDEEQRDYGSKADRLEALLSFGEELRSEKVAIKPAKEVIQLIKSVPTIMLGYDHATRVSGHPIERIATVHGPSGHGKTAFALALGKSFLMRDHLFVHIDAELTTPRTWVEKLYGPYFSHPGYYALHPESYEQTVDAVREHANRIAEAKDKGKLPPNTSCLFVVDSVRKLVPKLLFERLSKGAEEMGIDGFGGRAAQFRAALNAAWCDELVPLMHKTGCALMFITRESEDTAATPQQVKYKQNFKTGGGNSLIYDASILARISRGAYVAKNPDDPKSPTYGERHTITIGKTKVAGKDDRKVVTFFHTSNGVLVPEGFDTARDAIHLGKQFGLISTSGAWLTWNRRRHQGEHSMVKALSSDEGMLSDLVDEVRACFTSAEPTFSEDDEDDE